MPLAAKKLDDLHLLEMASYLVAILISKGFIKKSDRNWAISRLMAGVRDEYDEVDDLFVSPKLKFSEVLDEFAARLHKRPSEVLEELLPRPSDLEGELVQLAKSPGGLPSALARLNFYQNEAFAQEASAYELGYKFDYSLEDLPLRLLFLEEEPIFAPYSFSKIGTKEAAGLRSFTFRGQQKLLHLAFKPKPFFQNELAISLQTKEPIQSREALLDALLFISSLLPNWCIWTETNIDEQFELLSHQEKQPQLLENEDFGFRFGATPQRLPVERGRSFKFFKWNQVDAQQDQCRDLLVKELDETSKRILIKQDAQQITCYQFFEEASLSWEDFGIYPVVLPVASYLPEEELEKLAQDFFSQQAQ